MGALHRLYQSSLHYDNRYPTSADAFAAPQGNSTTNCFFPLPLGPGAFTILQNWAALIAYLFSFFLSHISCKPAQKKNGPKHCQGQKKV